MINKSNDSKQRLFEVIGRVDSSFKPKMNEMFGGDGSDMGGMLRNSMHKADNKPQSNQYQKEYDILKSEFGEHAVNLVFSTGLDGFTKSRTDGNYSLDAIKHTLGIVSKYSKDNPNNGIDEMDAKSDKNQANPKYTHFGVLKDSGLIVNGWDFPDISSEELKLDKNHYFFNDIRDMEIEPKLVNVVTTKHLQRKGIDPFDFDNWNKE